MEFAHQKKYIRRQRHGQRQWVKYRRYQCQTSLRRRRNMDRGYPSEPLMTKNTLRAGRSSLPPLFRDEGVRGRAREKAERQVSGRKNQSRSPLNPVIVMTIMEWWFVVSRTHTHTDVHALSVLSIGPNKLFLFLFLFLYSTRHWTLNQKPTHPLARQSKGETTENLGNLVHGLNTTSLLKASKRWQEK
jgi:hypothetical protein